jgi:hypothetical protein
MADEAPKSAVVLKFPKTLVLREGDTIQINTRDRTWRVKRRADSASPSGVRRQP